MLNTMLMLFAEAAQPAPGAPPQGGDSLFGNPIIVLLPAGLFLFYFLFLRPMRKQEQEKAALLNQIKKNDKIITHAGIYGTVISVSDTEDEITVKIDDNVRVKMVKNAILRNLTNEEAAKEAKDAKDAAKKGGKASSSTAVTTKEGGA